MEITWYGHSCFRLAERGMATVVTDPYDHTQIGYSPLKLKADIVTISHNLAGHNYLPGVKGDPYVISGPGEYEVGGVFVTAIQTESVTKNGEASPRNMLCLIDYGGLTVVHLGAIKRVPTQTQVEALGPVHIALVPVGGGSSLNASKAAEVISLLEPNVVIPMHYATPESIVKLDPIKKFIKEMGLSDLKPEPFYKVGGVSGLPEETHVVLLNYKNGA